MDWWWYFISRGATINIFTSILCCANTVTCFVHRTSICGNIVVPLAWYYSVVYKSLPISTSHFIILASYVNLCIPWHSLPINDGLNNTLGQPNLSLPIVHLVIHNFFNIWWCLCFCHSCFKIFITFTWNFIKSRPVESNRGIAWGNTYSMILWHTKTKQKQKQKSKCENKNVP